MKKRKKTLKQSASIQDRLKLYKLESVVSKPGIISGKGLLALVPFAAASMIGDNLSAQVCNTNVQGSYLALSYPSGSLRFDVDGDGTDDLIIGVRTGIRSSYFQSYFFVGPINSPTNFTIQGSSFYNNSTTYYRAFRLSAGSDINPSSFPVNNDAFLLGFVPSSTYAGYPIFYGDFINIVQPSPYLPSSVLATGFGYLGVKVNGSEGWISLGFVSQEIDDNGTPRIINEIYVTGFGFEQGVNTGNAIAGDCASILPVELSHFSGRQENQKNLLEWETASEVNNQGFYVQRSEDGTTFKDLAWINGVGNSSNTESYLYVDDAIDPSRDYYYRLLQIDYDGQQEIHPIIVIRGTKATTFSVGEFYPNPSMENNVSLPIQVDVKREVVSEIFDASGKLITRQNHSLTDNSSEINMQVSQLNTGVYFVKITSEKFTAYRKLIRS